MFCHLRAASEHVFDVLRTLLPSFRFSVWGLGFRFSCLGFRVDVRLPGKENSNYHDPKSVHLIIRMK